MWGGEKWNLKKILVVFQFVSQLISVGLKNNFAFLTKKFPVDYWEKLFKTMQILPDFWHLVEGLNFFDKNPNKTAFSMPTNWGIKKFGPKSYFLCGIRVRDVFLNIVFSFGLSRCLPIEETKNNYGNFLKFFSTD